MAILWDLILFNGFTHLLPVKNMMVFEGKALYFVGVVGVGCFSIQCAVVFRENVILQVVVLLKNAVLWVSFVQMGSCGLLTFKYTEMI